MQKLLVVLTFLILSFSSNAQRYVDLGLVLVNPTNPDTADLDSVLVDIDLYVINNGPDTLIPGDSMTISIYTPNASYPDVLYTASTINPGDTMLQWHTAGFRYYPFDSVNLCLGVSVVNSASVISDTVSSNNEACATIYKRKPAVNVMQQFNNKASAKLYPNPTDRNIYLATIVENPQQGVFMLMDMMGRMVLQKDFKLLGTQKIGVDIGSLPAGMYTYKLSSEDIALEGRIEKQ